mgnify:CR=1 FL=1
MRGPDPAGMLDAIPFSPQAAASPLPRAYHWVDGSAYLNHVILVRKARKAEPPASAAPDDLPEAAFLYVGTIDDAVAKAKKMAAEAA